MWDREQLDRWCGYAIIALIFAAVAGAALALGAVRGTEFVWVAGLVGVASVLWVARLWMGEDHRFLLHPVLWPALGFVGYAAVRYLGSPVEYFARQELILLLVYLVFWVVVIHNLHQQETAAWMVAGLMGLGMALSFYALVQMASGLDSVWWFSKPLNYAGRGGGTFINPNHLAALLVLILPLGLCQVFMGRVPPLWRILYGYASLVVLCGIGVTMSRGGWVAGVASLLGLGAWLFHRRRQRIPAIVMLVVLGVGGYLYFTKSYTARRRLEGTVQEGTAHAGHSREYLWKPAARMWLDHAVTGVGPGQFDVRFPQYRLPSIQIHPVHVHNEYLEILVEYGLVGGLLFLAGLGVMGWGVVKTSKFVERGSNDLGYKLSNRTAVFFGASFGLLAVLIHAVVEFHFHIPGVALATLMVCGVLVSNIRFATDNFWVTPRWWSAGLATILVGGVWFWAGPQIWKGALEAAQLNRAAESPAIDERLMGALLRAHEVERNNPRTLFELGENLRRQSWEGLSGWESKAKEAIGWLEQSARLNPFDPHARLRIALCYHWLRQNAEATPNFQRALELGPNDVYVANHVAWSYLIQGETAKARELFEKSIEWWPWGNSMAEQNLETLRRAQAPPKNPEGQ